MLVNNNYRSSNGSSTNPSIIEGYYNDSKFYEDASFTTEITGKSGNIYIDISTNKVYRWTGSDFIIIAGNADTVDGLHASDFANIIDLGENQTDTKTAVAQYGKTIIYRCINWIDYPSAAADSQGTIIAINYAGAGTAEIDQMWGMQIFISAHGTPIFIRWIANMSVGEWQPILTATGGTMTGALVAQSNTAYSTPQVRNVTMSTSAPSGGSNGQIHYKYS